MPGNVQNQNSTSSGLPFRNPVSKGFMRVSHKPLLQSNNKNQLAKGNTFRLDPENRSVCQITKKIDSKIIQNGGSRVTCNLAEQVQEISSKLGTLNLKTNRSNGYETAPSTNRNNKSSYSNFRDLSLYPTDEDIRQNKLNSLEPNLINGAYTDVEHYLDVQFKLLREDFMATVRSGVQHYRKSLSNSLKQPQSQFTYDGIRIYPETHFERIQSTKNNKLATLVNFDPKGKMKNFKWKESKRFMFGSLLLFTVNDFNHFFLCTVVERDVDALRAGKILVSLNDEVSKNPRFLKRSFLMAECETFFDPYFMVMKLLREFNEHTFPMKKYIVQGAVDPHYPAYLSCFGVLKVYDRIIAPISTNDEFWPTADKLELDQYQYVAFKAALTREFCVIQGPPGTGKTFIGLKIVQNIWHNAKSFNHLLKLPILVVCSTNHAVDQFLEGILKFTQNVVRVGGQSRSEILKKYNLRERSRAENRFVSNMAIKLCQREINLIGMLMKCVENPSGILRVSFLVDNVQSKYQFVIRDDNCLRKWLLSCKGDDTYYTESDFIKFKYEDEDKQISFDKNQEFADEEEEDDYTDDEVENFCYQEQNVHQINDESYYSISLQELGRECKTRIIKYFKMKKNANKEMQGLNFSSTIDRKTNFEKDTIIYYMRMYETLKKRLKCPLHNSEYVEELLEQDPEQLDLTKRWAVYWGWTQELLKTLMKQLDQFKQVHRENVQTYEECRQQQDLEIMSKADFIGMTTSGAARLNVLLKSLHPTVVVVEEAGEVLETHVVASLTDKCQHVILIGDHEQLRPITAKYELSKDYHMDVSLFERLVKNGMDCPVLNVQHRMRPEISCLITPLIYPNLKNHKSVLNMESVRGVKKDVFFIDHEIFETSMTDTSSKQNEHEARFVIRLAMYLIQQRYNPAKITILTTYAAQRTLLRNLQREYSLDNQVKCVVVDKYQGEENDIILLSLVRSNRDGNIGFLNTKNRVCVALSRAKQGFYIIGNMSCLGKRSALWQNIKKTLYEKKAIGRRLPLYCSIHNTLTRVASDDDFYHVREGGCNKMCKVQMDCGHVCMSMCHYTSGSHPRINCNHNCKNTCRRCKKLCPKKCWEKCEPCPSMVRKIIQECGHEVNLSCSVEPTRKNCSTCRGKNSFSSAKNSTRLFDGSLNLPNHSYSFSPTCSQKRRPFFFSCCLL